MEGSGLLRNLDVGVVEMRNWSLHMMDRDYLCKYFIDYILLWALFSEGMIILKV